MFELIHDVWIQLHVLRKRGFQTPWINLKYTNLSRSVWEILCSVSPHIVSGFFSFSIQIHRRITCNKFLHVPDCSCPVGWPDYSPGAGVPGYSVLIFGVGHLMSYTYILVQWHTVKPFKNLWRLIFVDCEHWTFYEKVV